MTKHILFLLFLCPTILLGQGFQNRQTTAQVDHVVGDILFQIPDNQLLAQVIQDLKTQGLEPIDRESFTPIAESFRMYRFTFDPSVWAEKTVLNIFKTCPSITAAQFNHYAQTRGNPNDPAFPQQWSLPKINAPQLWDKTTGGVTACGDTIAIGILEFGYWDDAADLQANIWVNKGEIPNDNIDNDRNGYVDDYRGLALLGKKDFHRFLSAAEKIAEKDLNHGLAVASVAGAVGNNGIAQSGVNWKVKLMLISGANSDSRIIEGYHYILQQHKKYRETNGREGAYVPITSLSAGYKGYTVNQFPLLCAVYDDLGKEGILNFIAVDNTFNDVEKNGDIPTLCGRNSQVAVTASNQVDDITGFAFSKKFVHLAAPGQSVPILRPNNMTEAESGTSFATPLAAGAAALLLSVPERNLCNEAKTNPVAAMSRLKDMILRGVDKTIFLETRTISGGRLNVWKAYQQLRRSFGQVVGDAYAILQMTPNPAHQSLFLKIQTPFENEATIGIFNTVGQAVYERTITEGMLFESKIEIKTATFPPGLYFLSLRAKTFEAVQKFVVTHP